MCHSTLRRECARVALALAGLALATAAATAAPPIQVGAPVLLDNVGTLADGAFPAIRAVGNGGALAVCWQATNGVIQARLYDASGRPLFPVIEVTRQAVSGTRLGLDLDSAGHLLVAWFRDVDPAPGLGPVGTLVARRFEPDGAPATGEVVVGTRAYFSPYYTDFAVKVATDGSFMAVWKQETPFSVVARAFAADGQPKGPGSVVNETDALSLSALALAFDGRGGLVAYGRSRRVGDQFASDVWVRWLDGVAAPSSDEIELDLTPPAFGGHQPLSVDFSPKGGFFLIYERCDPVTFDALCGAVGMLEATPTGTILFSRDVAPPNPFASFRARTATDSLGNLAIAVEGPSTTDLFALNRLGGAATQVGLAATTLPLGAATNGLVGLSPSLFGVAWYRDGWTYFQTIAVGGDATPAPSFYTVEPCRLLDTRLSGATFVAGEDRAVQATGACSIPTGARALAANVVSLGSTSGGDLRFYRPDRLVPATSALNYGAGQVRANAAVIGLDDAGALGVRATQLGGTTHLLIDVSGYFQ